MADENNKTEEAGEKKTHFNGAYVAIGVGVGAAIGAAIGIGLALLASPASPLTIPFLTKFASAIGGAAASGVALSTIGGVLGAATGSMIGLDRYYVRRWMDGAEVIMYDQGKYEEINTVRAHEASKLSTIAREAETQDKGSVELHVPKTRIYSADYQDRVATALQHAPVV